MAHPRNRATRSPSNGAPERPRTYTPPPIASIDDWTKVTPQPVDAVDLEFGRIAGLLPPWDTIPDEYRNPNDRTPFNRLVSQWFFEGLDGWPLTPKPGIDSHKAQLHVLACLSSFEPKHEHKSAGCAYLLSLWFEPPATPGAGGT